MNRSITLLAGALALALAACNADRSADTPSGETGPRSGATDDPNAGHPDATGGDAAAPGAMGAASGADSSAMATDLAPADRNALMSVMEVDRHEIASAEAALAKGVGEDARRYAETLRDDHTRNLETTRSLLGGSAAGASPGTATGAAGPGDDAMPSDPGVAAMSREHESERQRLDVLQGDAFESAWIDAMAKGHEKALGMLDGQLLPGASDDRVRSHLQATRDAVARHLETAKSLQSGR
jgi:putative membrane protein